MLIAWLSMAALIVVIAISCTSRLNVGLLAIALAWILGVYVAPIQGYSIGARGVIAGFPAELFVTLLGVTLLFSLLKVNGTMEQVAAWAVGCCRGNAALVAPMFFILTALLSTLGAGNIAAAAILAPMAAAVSARSGTPPLLMVIMVGHGAIAGGLSPFSPMGIIADNLLESMSLSGGVWRVFAYNFAANVIVAAAGYLLLQGWRAVNRGDQAASDEGAGLPAAPFRRAHMATLAAAGVFIVAVVCFGAHVGLASFAVTSVLISLRLADEGSAFRQLPWGVMVMVCGMTMLVAILEKTGGLELFTDILASCATQSTLVPLIAWTTGLISVFSSTSGVVLPTFLPTAAGLVERLGGECLAVATAITIGSNIVDISPISTIGALCIAPLASGNERTRLFLGALAWGLSMSLVGAFVCWALVG